MDVIEAVADGTTIRLRFRLDEPGVVGWQLYDPSTGAFLQEGEWSEVQSREADLRIPLPVQEGAYSVQVAPVKDRSRYIGIEARVGAGALEIDTPQCGVKPRHQRRALCARPQPPLLTAAEQNGLRRPAMPGERGDALWPPDLVRDERVTVGPGEGLGSQLAQRLGGIDVQAQTGAAQRQRQLAHRLDDPGLVIGRSHGHDGVLTLRLRQAVHQLEHALGIEPPGLGHR